MPFTDNELDAIDHAAERRASAEAWADKTRPTPTEKTQALVAQFLASREPASFPLVCVSPAGLNRMKPT